MDIVLEVAIAMLSILLSYGISEQQQQGTEGRTSRETWMRQAFQAAKDRYGVTLNQLDQALEKLGLRLTQLTDTTRGSARLSRASKIYRDFIQAYPEKVAKINGIKNTINGEINSLNSKESAYAAKIQQRGEVSDEEIAGDIASSTNTINTSLGTLDDGERTEQIDVTVKPQETNNSTSTTAHGNTVPWQWNGVY